MTRDIDKQPYSADEKRVVDFLYERGVGGGDDPIGFILASYAFIVARAHRRDAAKKRIAFRKDRAKFEGGAS